MRSTQNFPEYLESLKSLFQTGTMRQLFFMIGIAVSVAVGIILYMSIQEPTYQPLDYQVNHQNMASIVDTLEKAGIQYKISDKDGMLMVAAKDLQLAKLKLSASGIAKDDSFNYSFLNEQNNFGNTQFVENARYLRALENDLAKTINSIEGVGSARVHIAVPQNTVFADEGGKTTASVMLSMAPGLSSDKEKIRAIVQIVAGSVPGLDPREVSITDQYGHYLSSGLGPDNLFSAEQLSYQNNVQSYYEKRIESLIVPLLGENKVSVRVFADIDFTQHEEAEEQYDPDKKVLRSEQSTSEQNDSGGGASGAPGALSNSPPADPNAGANGDKGGASSGGSQSRSQSTKNYEITKSVNYKKSNFAKVKSLSVAVVVDNDTVMDPKTKQMVSKPIDQDKLNKITRLVQATIGYDQAKGDKVTVLNSGFTAAKADVAPMVVHLWDQVWFWDMAKKIMGISLGFVFLFLIYRRLVAYGKNIPNIKQRRIATEEVENEAINTLEAEKQKAQLSKQEKISQLKQLAVTEPNKVASIIKNWIGKQ